MIAIKSSSHCGPARFGVMLLLVFSFLVSPLLSERAPALFAAGAQGEREKVELSQALLDLQNPWTVMCIAAHPDDEDGATLTLLRRKYGVHTVTLFSTYGEGGQNAIGPELYEELGAIRARETVAAAAIQGSEAHFLGLKDFGFSKSADEAFRVWNHTEALRRMVQKIRELRPDVIITNHDTISGHGHHQATGRLALEAFEAAADPTRFPEQLTAGLATWQPQRLFVRVNYEGGTGSKATEDEAQRAGTIVTFNINERDPMRGQTYAEQALEALHQHASQGPWPQTLPPGGRPPIRYRLARQAPQAQPLPANAPNVLDGLALPEPVALRLAPLAAKAILPVYAANGCELHDALGPLVGTRKAGMFDEPATFLDQPRARLMSARLDQALAVASGITATLTPTTQSALIPGSPIAFQVTVNSRGRGPNNERAGIHVKRLSFRVDGREVSSKGEMDVAIEPEHPVVFTEEYLTPADALINVPHAAHLYDGQLFGHEFKEEITLEMDGARFPLNATTRLDVVPPVEIARITPSMLVLTPATAGAPSTFTVRLNNHLAAPFTGQLITGSLLDHSIIPGPIFTIKGSQTAEQRVSFTLRTLGNGSNGHAPEVAEYVPFVVRPGGSKGSLTGGSVRAVYSDARVAQGLRVGYVPSYDDTLKNALAALGVNASELTIDDVRDAKLKGYDTIIIDNRGYQAHPELVAANARLLEYAKAGGTLIVFYHKNFEWNPDPQRNRPQLAPYPLTLGNARVTEENAPVAFNEPQHPLLNFPNTIGPDDFKDWVQERGLYYPKDWDAHYSAPLSSGDTGEQPLRGGLLAADFGRGRYIYTSMVWYRQLRAGVPGAYRIFANMISYGHTGEGAARK
jgi:LmbE family N-acetylglucosaminyl deacetylase